MILKIILQHEFTYKYNLYNVLTEQSMDFHHGGDLVSEQARAEVSYCLCKGRCFNLETEVKERKKVRYELKDQFY